MSSCDNTTARTLYTFTKFTYWFFMLNCIVKIILTHSIAALLTFLCASSRSVLGRFSCCVLWKMSSGYSSVGYFSSSINLTLHKCLIGRIYDRISDLHFFKSTTYANDCARTSRGLLITISLYMFLFKFQSSIWCSSWIIFEQSEISKYSMTSRYDLVSIDLLIQRLLDWTCLNCLKSALYQMSTSPLNSQTVTAFIFKQF